MGVHVTITANHLDVWTSLLLLILHDCPQESFHVVLLPPVWYLCGMEWVRVQ